MSVPITDDDEREAVRLFTRIGRENKHMGRYVILRMFVNSKAAGSRMKGAFGGTLVKRPSGYLWACSDRRALVRIATMIPDEVLQRKFPMLRDLMHSTSEGSMDCP